MLEIRIAEEMIRNLANEGKAWGAVHSVDGQEAVSVGVAAATGPQHPLTASHRTHGISLALGMNPESLFAELMGRSAGATRGLGGTAHMTMPSVGLINTASIVGSQIPISVGHALASKITAAGTVAICIFGDGAANIGAFHESLNLARIWELPVVFICENNMYGEHTHVSRSTPIADIASRGDAYDMAFEIVDGQVVDDVIAATQQAIERARHRHRPTLLEMKTYRYQPHARSDPIKRPPGELEAWRKRDPIELYARVLRSHGHDADELTAIEASVKADLASALLFAEASADAPTASMFEYVSAN